MHFEPLQPFSQQIYPWHLQPVLLAARLRDPASLPRDNSADEDGSKIYSSEPQFLVIVYQFLAYIVVESCKLFHFFKGHIFNIHSFE